MSWQMAVLKCAAFIAGHGFVRFPCDAESMPWHLGDFALRDGSVVTVDRLVLSESGWAIEGKDDAGERWRCNDPSQARHCEILGMPWPDATEAEVRAVATLSTGCARRCGIEARAVAERILRVLGWTYNTRRKK